MPTYNQETVKHVRKSNKQTWYTPMKCPGIIGISYTTKLLTFRLLEGTSLIHV